MIEDALDPAPASVHSFDAGAAARQRELVVRMAVGDAEAMRELHGIHAGRLFRIAAGILRDREDVREAVQDAFAKAWRLAGSYRPERGEVTAWLVFIVRSAAIDRLRRASREKAVVCPFPEGIAPDEALAQKPAVEALETREYLDRRLDGVSPEQRQALRLSFFEGCTQAEIARRMGTPIGNVKNHLRRGLLKLRQGALRHD